MTGLPTPMYQLSAVELRALLEDAQESYDLLSQDYQGLRADYNNALKQISELKKALIDAGKNAELLKTLEHQYCIEGDYCSDNNPVYEAVVRLHEDIQFVAQQRDAANKALERANDQLVAVVITAHDEALAPSTKED